MKLKMFLVLLILVGFGYAETDEMKKEGMKKEGKGMMSPPSFQENIEAEAIEALKVAKIKKELDLTPEQAGKFFENYYRVAEVRKEFLEKKITLINAINSLLSEKEFNEKTVEEKVKAYYKLEREMQEKTREVQEKVVDGLSLKQKAKLIVFEKNFEKNVRETLKKMMGKRKQEEWKNEDKKNPLHPQGGVE
ncbi:MAG: hypothetical protein ABH873_01905 [Candidatus Firestonebacteria bacterium]